MLHRLASVVLACLLLSLAPPSHAQQPAGCADCLSRQEAREDLQTLYDTLQQEHVDLFARRTKADYDAHVARLMASITGPVPAAQFHLIVQDALAFGRIGHARTDAVLGDAIGHIRSGGRIIPLSVRYRGDSMITDEWAMAEGDALPPGSRITRIGGLDVSGFEDRLRPMISADTDLLLRSQVERLMPGLVYLVFGDVDTLRVDYVGTDGAEGSVAVPATGIQDMYAMQDARPVPRPARDPSQRVFRDLGNGVFYLQPGPFYATPEERGESGEDYQIGPYKTFVEKAFAALAASGAQSLVIDLRDNPGGDTSFSDLVVARLVEEPYRFASRYEIRAGANTKASWADKAFEPGSLLANIAQTIADAGEGARVRVELPPVQPIRSDAFDGPVFALVNRHSFSNAAVVAALMQDLDIATIVGEETADLATTYGAVERFSLPHSGATIEYPKAYMVRPSGDETVRGVVPDIAIAPTPVGESRDVMLDAAVAEALRAE